MIRLRDVRFCRVKQGAGPPSNAERFWERGSKGSRGGMERGSRWVKYGQERGVGGRAIKARWKLCLDLVIYTGKCLN